MIVRKDQRLGIPHFQSHLYLVKIDMPCTSHAYLPHRIQYVLVVIGVLPTVLEQLEEVLSAVLKVHTEELTHFLRHLTECDRSFQRTGLLHQRIYIMVNIKRP